jgi:SET domain-containing protein
MKEQLILQLTHKTFVKLQASPLHGIGVFAARDIPKGTKNIFSAPHNRFTHLTYAEVVALPEHSRALIENFCLYDETGYFVPDEGFDTMDIALYLNHSDEPNIRSVDDGDYFEALIDIPAGTELLVDYGTIVDSKE